MSLHKTLYLLFLIVYVLLLTPLAHGDFREGMDAAKRGDHETALNEWLPLAAQGDIDAQFALGFLYNTGQGVPQDYAQAHKWYLKAAAQGHATAQVNLGVLYANGQGVPSDYAQARKWYLKAAAQGHATAQFNLGVLYANGQGVPSDYAQAREWYLKAAAQGHARAQVKLGVLYAEGRSVPQDYVFSHMWFNLAAAQGEELAVIGRDQIAQKMTQEQIAEAQRLAREWKPIRSKVERGSSDSPLERSPPSVNPATSSIFPSPKPDSTP